MKTIINLKVIFCFVMMVVGMITLILGDYFNNQIIFVVGLIIFAIGFAIGYFKNPRLDKFLFRPIRSGFGI